VNSPVRSFKRVGGTPLLASHAEGPYLWDIDKNKYIDCVMSYGPHLFGHQCLEIVQAVQETLKEGMCFGMTSPAEIEWAELLLKQLPSANKVRAMSSGTEACTTAIRLARGYTGRNIIVKCSGHYHGHVDSLMVDAGSGLATLSDEVCADSAGIPSELVRLVKVIPFNDSLHLEKVFEEFGSQIAAFIMEPVMGNMGVVAPNINFLKKARELTQQYKSLLIFDEVMTGFRVSQQSAQGRFDIKPDLTTLGKIVGGGAALSALAGKKEIMDHLAPLGNVYQAGTLSGNPISISAGMAMMKKIEKQNPYPELEELGAFLESLIINCAKKNQIKLSVGRVGSMLSVFFRTEAPKNALETRDINEPLFKKFFWALIEEGILIPPSPFEAYFLSYAHLEIPKKTWEEKMDHVFKKIRS
jgi:glutamate-1-semialdehyde 2,1-aminomutase